MTLLTLIHYSHLLFSHRPVKALYKERPYIFFNLKIIELELLPTTFTHIRFFISIVCIIINIFFSICTKFADLCYSYQFLILYTYHQVSTAPLVYWHSHFHSTSPQCITTSKFYKSPLRWRPFMITNDQSRTL